ncbi:uncharacterized protein PHALS_02261 [Plasmopara halstedii]|uniref:RxLR-like protein n=1 Tax=Plasmopara halstedii TaxID=4781 RepID=A0A0P1AXI3_PLAHL|nr:uncharacterized protein PHALS_02261 [Plasmopara halstedii]CEG45928.1 hypothetical protein PHALS_02261 [Plasmopara halstedii]|eukprot:XP_024582297.1 hypothetical protein PHALS_02261 [Plasmopara halstedii]
MRVLAAFFIVACYAFSTRANLIETAGKVSPKRLIEPHPVTAAETNSAHSERVLASYDERLQIETTLGGLMDEERGEIPWMSKIYDAIGRLAMKLRLNPKLVYMLSRAGVDHDKNVRFVRWLKYVSEYRARKGGISHFTDSAIYNLVKKKKTDAEVLMLFQSIRHNHKLSAANDLASQMLIHVAEILAKTDWLAARKSPQEVFHILGLAREDDDDHFLFVWWLNYVNSYNKLEGNVIFTGQNLYDLLSVTKSDTAVATLSVALQQTPEFTKIAEALQDIMVSKPALRQKMYDAWLQFAVSPYQVYITLRLNEKSHFSEALLTEWFHYIKLFWSGPEGNARQSEFHSTDCIDLLRSTHSDQDLWVILYSISQDPDMTKFTEAMLMHLQVNEHLPAGRVSPTEFFNALKLDSVDDADNSKLYLLLTYVNDYRAIANGKNVEFTDEDLYDLLQKLKSPVDLFNPVERLQQVPDIMALIKRMQIYMVTQSNTRQKVYEALLRSSTTPEQALEIFRSREGRYDYLYGEWLGYLDFYWSGPEAGARYSVFGYDDCIAMLRSKVGSDDAVNELLESIKERPDMNEIADGLLEYLKITRHNKSLLDSHWIPEDLLSFEAEDGLDYKKLREWLVYVDMFRNLDGDTISDEDILQILRRQGLFDADVLDLITWLQRFPYTKEIAERIKKLIS